MNTHKGNKLIAQFIGKRDNNWKNIYCYDLPQLYHDMEKFGESFHSSYLKFHKSWNWLMPVIEKIMDMEGQNYEFIMKNTYFAVYDNRKKKYLIEKCHFYEGYSRIRAAWVTVVQFIQYLNEMKKTRSVFKSPEESPYLYRREEYYV